MVSRLEREMREQGADLARREDAGWADARIAAELIGADDVDYVLVAARGSSDNAARYGQYLLGAEAGIVVALATPWLFGEGRRPPRLARAAVLAISQSGRSPDVAAVLAAARDQRRPALAITNDPTSPVASLADVVVELRVPPERSVAATKTYVASLHALAQITALVAGRTDWRESLRRLPAIVSQAVESQLENRERFDLLADFAPVTAVGRGLDYATAFETALKVRELTGRPAEAFSPPDLVHGPIASTDARTSLWAVSSGTNASSETLKVIRRLAASVGLTTAVSADPRILDLADIRIPLPTALPPWAGPIVAIVPGQAASLRLAELRGVDVDSPPGLNKVTMTR
jgi:glucosamine--fructose-6-phosphate aminotransferase (isomerizing)